MTDQEAVKVLDDLLGPERIEAAEAVLMLRDWEQAGVNPRAAVTLLSSLRPTEVMEVLAYARRKAERVRRR